MSASQIIHQLQSLATDPQRKSNEYFFKMGKGQYAEFDQFIGVRAPQLRAIAQRYFKTLPLSEIDALLQHSTHEIRHCGLIILVKKYQASERKSVFDYYVAHLSAVNNWDLVDNSAPHIIGDYLQQNPQHLPLLFDYARTENLWQKRIAIVATFAFIKQNSFDTTLDIALILLNDKHDLIHKAIGWMLREIYKKDANVAEQFLQTHYKNLPRTTLRYAIEWMPTPQRKRYLQGIFNRTT